MRIPQLTFTRFVAAIAIVFFHQGNTYPFSIPAVSHWISFGNVLVSYFFVLSGFILIISSVQDGELSISKKTFWFNRFARIYPLYFFALIMWLALGLYRHSPGAHLRADRFVLTAMLLQSWFPRHAVTYNAVAWSLSVEAFFYILFPFLVATIARVKWSIVPWTGLAIWGISLWVHIYTVDRGYPRAFTLCFPLWHVNSFIGGVIAGVTFMKYRNALVKNNRWLLLLCMVLSGIVIGAIGAHNDFIRRYYRNGLLTPLFISWILYLSALEKGTLKRVLSHPWLQYLGEISYGIYILQVALLLFIYELNDQLLHWPHTPLVYLYMVALIGFSALCHEVIEKPARKYLKRTYYRLTATPARQSA